MKGAAIIAAFVATALAAPRQRDASLLGRSTRVLTDNWSGGVVQGEKITAVSGTFPVIRPTIPTKSEPGKDSYQATAWIGLGGYAQICPENSGLWQAGVMTSHSNILNHTIWYQAWYELYPDPPVFIDIGNITEGDIMTVSLEVIGNTQGRVDIQNESTGKGYSLTTNITMEVCQQTAEWIVERAYTLSGLVGLLNFGTESIYDIGYTDQGVVHTTIPDDVILVDIQDDETNNTVQTNTVAEGSAIKVTYLGS